MAGVAKFRDFADHFGSTIADDFNNRPKAEYIPNITRRPEFGFASSIRRHRRASLMRFLPTWSLLVAVTDVVILGGVDVVIPKTDSSAILICQEIANFDNSAQITDLLFSRIR